MKIAAAADRFATGRTREPRSFQRLAAPAVGFDESSLFSVRTLAAVDSHTFPQRALITSDNGIADPEIRALAQALAEAGVEA